jgi:hypothetical protein
METNQILIIVFSSFSTCGLLLSFCLICRHKLALNREIKLIQELKNNRIKHNRVKPLVINYTLEYPQQETKDENDDKIINITISSV